ncbi:PTS sugar transporter subunit IIA [Lacticaseibacillus daqingensis]|uniref:PTS sugar transporter subunit IIA n=1 Tax=Lacticaseibacillus daqingensis TaxID=2486014 RepID=UPI000F7AA83B|nr:PTS glucose transporter subunit IIA [Lacticaseibacillus daqingensis]
MFGLGKKDTRVASPCAGSLLDITEVSDKVFSSKALGDGFAVVPSNGVVTAPVAGTINMIFPTKHAISVKTAQGLEVLIHMGFDTVELEGKPFTLHVKIGDKVKPGMPLADANLAQIKASGRETTIVVIYTNMALLKNFPKIQSGTTVTAAQVLGELQYK